MNSTAKKRKGAVSLLELAERQCLRFHFMIEDVGDAGYDLVEPILRKMSSTQLISIEKNCPQIRARSNGLWKSLIRKDFCDRPLPDNVVNYRKLYVRYFKEKEEHLQDASIRLRESMNKFKKEKQARTITSLERDPLAERARKRQVLSGSGPPGSKLIQKAYQTARAKGKMFSPRNTKFGRTRLLNENKQLETHEKSKETEIMDKSSKQDLSPDKPIPRKPSTKSTTPGIFLPRRTK